MMLTSAEQKADVERCRQLGIAVYLLKPIKPAELRHALLRALGQAEPPPGRRDFHPLARHNLRPLHILLVEDNAVNQTLAVRLLQKWGHTVVTAGNGTEALAVLAHDTFDLALMDVQMPEMDGLEATRRIRQREQSTQTYLPIIAMTAHAMMGDKERCLAAGIDDYVSKPLKPGELQAAIERITTAIVQPREAEAIPNVAVHAERLNSMEL